MDTSARVHVEEPTEVFKCEEHGEYLVIEARTSTDEQAASKLIAEPHSEGQRCSPRARGEGLEARNDSPPQAQQEVCGFMWLNVMVNVGLGL